MVGGQVYDSSTSQNNALLYDIWEWVPGGYDTHTNGDIAGTFTGQWVWQGGFSIGNQSGIYGTQGVAAAGCATGTTTGCVIPGGRWAAATATDPAGNVWLYGGQGYDSAGKVGLLNDLWEYSAGTWTLVSGTTTADQNGAYPASVGTGGTAFTPGGRQTSVLWVDSTGKIWLFGGFGLDSKGTSGGTGQI